jgi:hypothetical protein
MRRRRLFIASGLLAAFFAAIALLPWMAAALGLGVLLGLAGVCLFDEPRWRTGALLAASVAGGFTLIELASDFVLPRPVGAGTAKVYTPRDWISPDAVLGYRPRRDTRVEAVATWGDETVYRRTYMIDGTGARVTPGSAPTGDTYLFVGDSFVFGVGLTDNETLPSQFAQSLASRGPTSSAHVVNLGVPGYGLNQLVRALETGAYDRYVAGPVKAVVTWLIPAQLGRVNGEAGWLGNSPRYVLGADGAPVFTGSFEAHRLTDPIAGLAYLARRKIESVTAATGGEMEREGADLFVALLSRLRQLVDERYKAPLVVMYQWPQRSTIHDAAQLSTLDWIEQLRTPLVNVSSLIKGDQPTYIIPHDGHPSALFVRMVAEALDAQLGSRPAD